MKKIFSLLTAFVFSFVMFAPGFVLAADNAALSTSQKLEKVEQMLYGNTQGGSLIQRMDTIENDVYGKVIKVNNGTYQIRIAGIH